MSLRFVTRKLKTQSLTDQDEPDKFQDSCSEESECEDGKEEEKTTDSGIGSVARSSLTTLPSLPSLGNQESLELPSVFCLPPVSVQAPNFAKPLIEDANDGYSSEEELKEIISCKKQRKMRVARTKRASATSAATRLYSSASSNGSRSSSRNKSVLGSSINAVAGVQAEGQKRKWSEVSDFDSGAMRRSGGTLSAPANARIFVRGSGESFSCSSCSSQQSDEVEDRGVATPVQFCTSPPIDVHRPKRGLALPSSSGQLARSPPTKLFHFQPASDNNGFTDYNTGLSSNEQDLDDEVCATVAADDRNFEVVRDENMEEIAGQENVQKVPPNRHHLHRRSQSQNRLHQNRHWRRHTTPSPHKRHHRLNPRKHQRPCLDFEKMQQIKKRVVTSWRPQGGELSLFCW